MGCSCENSSEEIKHYQANIKKIKENCIKEYNSYLNFIYKLKGYLNVSQCTENLSMDEIEENKHEKNIATKKEFYLIPSKWFEDWEKWIKNIIIKNEFKALRTKFKYKNFKNKEKFYFYIMTEENWVKISKNKLYNFSEEFKTKIGLISNNLIILQYDTSLGEKNEFEIFFFEKDDDLFLTNLLFSFEKCNDANLERNNLLTILKSSPIYEILGNMHYDQSQSEFFEEKKKILIYNKTRILTEEIKKFRKKQYEIFLESYNKTLKEEIESDRENQMKNRNDIVQETALINVNKPNNKIISNNPKNESQAISRASTIMNPNNHQNLINSYTTNEFNSKLKATKKDDIFMDNMNGIKDDDENNNSKEIKLSDKLLLNTKLRNTSRKKLKVEKSDGFNSNINELEITEIIENRINEDFLISTLYCFFNISHLRDYIHKNFEINIESTRLYLVFSNLINYLYEKMCATNNSVDTKKISNCKFNLIRNCDEYNYQKLAKIIKDTTGKNVIAKMINLLHTDINKKFKNYSSKQIDKNNKDPKYNEFISNITPIHNSIIFDIFFGIKKVTKKCNNCKGKSITYKLINVITLSIDRIKQNFVTKDITRQKTGKETNVITSSIEECLSYYLKEEKDCDGLFKCPSCNSNEKYNKIKEICEYPDCTVFYLNNSKQENIKINFKKNIILSNNDYELIGIISQQNNEEEKKFIPYCQDIINKIWFRFEQDNICEIDMNEEKNKIRFPIALFYQKIK